MGNGLRDQRVCEIVRRKMIGRWYTGSAAAMAKEWGVGVGYVHELACDANKAIRRSATDPDAVAAELIPDLMATLRAASRAVRERRGDPHAQASMASAVASLTRFMARIGGLIQPKRRRVEVTPTEAMSLGSATAVEILG